MLPHLFLVSYCQCFIKGNYFLQKNSKTNITRKGNLHILLVYKSLHYQTTKNHLLSMNFILAITYYKSQQTYYTYKSFHNSVKNLQNRVF